MKKSRFIEILITAFITLLMFQRTIVQYIPLFAYYDEFVMGVFIILSIPVIIGRKKVIKEDIILFILIILMIISGLAGNMLSGYNRSMSIKLEAILFWFKSLITFICAFSFFKGKDYKTNNIIKYLAKITKIIVIFATIILVISPLTQYGISGSTRYGLRTFNFIYPTAAIFSWYCILYMMILTTDSAINKKSNYEYIIMTCIIWFFTLRSRAFSYIAIYWILYFILFKFSKEKLPKIKKKYILIAVLIALYISVPAIEKYFLNSNTSRAILLRTGITIGKKYFPLGAGFGNYGSSPAYKNYSSVYYYYGFNRIYGLRNSEGSNELTDTYWPSVIGEMGVLGLIIMICFLIFMYKRLLYKTKNNKWLYLCELFFVLTSLFSSVATAVFSADIMMAYILIATISCYIKVE